jgi:hypothetical protein
MDGSSTNPTKMPRSMSDLRCLAPTVEVEEEDLNMEHMRVVDGWSTYGLYPSLNKPTHRRFSGLRPGFIATNSLLRAGRYLKRGG